MSVVEVFITADCFACVESRRIITELSATFPEITFELIDLTEQIFPEEVFAVPTYKINGTVKFIGNPHPHKLKTLLIAESVYTK